MSELPPEQKGSPSAEEISATLRALYDPQTPEEEQLARESQERVRANEERLREGLPHQTRRDDRLIRGLVAPDMLSSWAEVGDGNPHQTSVHDLPLGVIIRE